tara:strand:+ start:137 stop:520 length:384 start_codon:yes stop_codon:yes gene_type:complete
MMRIVKAKNPPIEIAAAVEHAKKSGYTWWGTAENGVYADDLIVFKVGDSSGGFGVLYSVDIVEADDIDEQDFLEHRPDSWPVVKQYKRYHKVVGGRVEFIPRSEMRMRDGEPLHVRALRTNVIVDFD